MIMITLIIITTTTTTITTTTNNNNNRNDNHDHNHTDKGGLPRGPRRLGRRRRLILSYDITVNSITYRV